MSYPDQVPARRPAVVGLAAAVLLLMAVGALAYAIVGLVALGGTVDRLRATARGTAAGPEEVDGVVTLLRSVVVASAVLTVLVGALLVGLALGLLARRNGARVGAWVVCGLGLLAGCCGLAALVGQRAAPLRLGGGEPATAELLGLLGDAYPSWWVPVNAALSVGQALGYVVVAALLALPAANAWFRRPRPAPVPVGFPPAGPPYPTR
ncbi:hypothetical protein ACFY2R_00505 [Micromonospora olivasterospora]|uniref:Uncharacterized protein n=1 Tax=Micromonospora olivasterospora TaxID=1880 RepID=A0A562IA91_MICOL|nr:hypothetical protein [Micromonospora olivasterospora]TWH67625.1 hypothetical protein JD77_02605 [Micromonospora olivasterospora]